jgi:hypothetical protein
MRIFGNILIFIGIIFLLSLLVLSEYHFKAGYFQTIQYKEIILGGEKNLLVDLGLIQKGEKILISCKHVFVVGVLIILAGVYAVALYQKPKIK